MCHLEVELEQADCSSSVPPLVAAQVQCMPSTAKGVPKVGIKCASIITHCSFVKPSCRREAVSLPDNDVERWQQC